MPERQAAPGTDRIGQARSTASAWGCVRMWIKGARPLTLVMSVVSVLSAAVPSYLFARGYGLFALWGRVSENGAPIYAQVSRTGDSAAVWRFAAVAVLCLTVAVSMQIAANYFNDYADGVKGVDAGRSDEGAGRPESGAGRLKAASGPGFNAPQRLVASGVPPRKVLKAGVICTVIAIAAGIAAAGITRLWALPAVGLLCIAAAWFYSGGKKPYGYRGLGEAAAFAVFGPVAVFGTEWALLGVYMGDYIRYSGARSLAAPVGSGALALILMLLNNMRDAESDRVHGKLTFSATAPRGWSLAALIAAVAVCQCIQSRTVIYVAGMSCAMHPPVVAAVAAIGVLQLVFAVFVIIFAYTYRYHSAFCVCIALAYSYVAVMVAEGFIAVL
ncbi:MAG: prenyltransferase [Scardovia wiggsiae]